MRMRFDMRGLRTDIAEEELMRRMVEGMKDACEMMEAAAVEECPEGEHEGSDTVALAMTIASKVEVEGTSVIGTVGTGADYAVYVHEGTGIRSRTGMGRTHDLPWSYQDDRGEWHTTSGMSANPFLERAYTKNIMRARQIIREKVLKG